MALKIFNPKTPKSSGYPGVAEPFITLSRNGSIRLNEKALEKIGVEAGNLVALVYDEEEFAVGVIPWVEGMKGKAYVASQRETDSSVQVHAARFVEAVGFSQPATRRYLLRQIATHNDAPVWGFSLTDEPLYEFRQPKKRSA